MQKKHRNESSEEDDASEEQEEKKQPKPKKQPKFESKNVVKPIKTDRITINISDCQYPVVRLVAKMLKWKVQTDPQATEWDMWWTDNAVQPETLFRMQHHQKINHFPGMYTLARKNLLGKGLMKMKKQFPQSYNFFPLTWLLPSEYSQFRLYFESKPKGKSRTYIVKPEALSQGKGIFLTRRLQDLVPGQHYVVQRYLHKPYLIDGLKFDFRIYVLLAGVDPLRVYLYNEGLARFATQPYVVPTKENMEDVCMHLTNYAINKDNPNFIFNESQKDMSIGHKRSLSSVYELLRKKGEDVDALLTKIKDILIKTLISGLPLMRHQYRSCQLENYAANMCFEVLGFDVMLTGKGDPYLLEVNHTPSFTTDTPLDELIKKNLIRDSLVLMNINTTSKATIINAKREEINNRVLTGKKMKLAPEERQALRAEAQKQRDQYEDQHLGGFQKIYPCNSQEMMEEYQSFIEHAEKLYEDSTGIKKKNKQPNKIVERAVEKAQSVNQAPKRTKSINKTARQPIKIQSESEETKLTKQDSGFLPQIRSNDSPNHHETPVSQKSLKVDSVKSKSQDEQRHSSQSLHVQSESIKISKDNQTQKEIMESLNKNYAQYVFLKDGLRKKNSIEDKTEETKEVKEQPPKNYVNQVNFSFFINQVKIDLGDKKKGLDGLKKKQGLQNNNRTTSVKQPVDRSSKHPLSLNTLLQSSTESKTQGATSISNLKQLLNRKRQAP